MQDFKSTAKRVGKDALFFLILGALIVGISCFMWEESRKDENLIQSRNKSIVRIEKEPQNTLDVLILGDSLAYTSFSPLQLWNAYGMTSYVCAQSGQKVQETYYMLKTALETQQPKLVILETNFMFHEQKGVNAFKQTIAEKANYYLPIFRFHDIWKPLLVKTAYTEENYKGFQIRDNVKAYTGGTYMVETTDTREFAEFVDDYMGKIIKLCEENQAQILLVSAPSPKNYNYQKHNKLTEYAQSKGLPYLDFNVMTDTIGIDWKSDALDAGDHLNLLGACKVTEYIGTYLKQNYTLSDHRSDTAYGSWETEAKEYQKKAAERQKNMS